jgi:hypothetical protein
LQGLAIHIPCSRSFLSMAQFCLVGNNRPRSKQARARPARARPAQAPRRSIERLARYSAFIESCAGVPAGASSARQRHRVRRHHRRVPFRRAPRAHVPREHRAALHADEPGHAAQRSARAGCMLPGACCPLHFRILPAVLRRLSSVTSCLLQCSQRLSVACCVLHVACAQGCAFSSGCGAWRPLQRCLSPLVPCSLPLGRRCPLQRCNAARCNAASCDASTVPICRGAGPRLHFVALRPIERGEVRYEWPQSYESPI